jgi:hypothetical protein
MHFICVYNDVRKFTIKDLACHAFTESFYKALFLEKRTVLDAFKEAKEFIRVSFRSEVEKFILLPKGEEDRHRVKIKQPTSGRMVDMSPRMPISNLPRYSRYVGQEESVVEIYRFLHRPHTASSETSRPIIITGAHGVGKSQVTV